MCHNVASEAIERDSMKCLNCGSSEVTEPLAVADDGAYPSGNHKVTKPAGRIRKSKAPTSRLSARVCTECGYTALFAENPGDLAG